MTDSLTVVIPVYNEADLLEQSVSAIEAYLAGSWPDHEIVIVESGSTDGSGERCDALARRFPSIRVIHEGSRNGFGAAVKTGYRHAGKDAVTVVTVDQPFPLTSLDQARPLLDRVDCVLSYRATDPRPIGRRLQSFVYNTLVRAVLNLPMRHVNSALKVLRRDVAQRLIVGADGWFFDAELLYRVTSQRLSWMEIPVPLVDRAGGRGSVGPLTFLSLLRELLQFAKAERKRT